MTFETYPKDLFVGVYHPGRKLAEIMLVVANRPGSLAQITAEIARHNVNILTSSLNAPPEATQGTYAFFADFTESKFTPKQLVESLRALKVVLDARWEEPFAEGLVVDKFTFPLLALGVRSISLSADAVAQMVERLKRDLSSAAYFVLYDMGVALGERKVETTAAAFGLKGRKLIEEILLERLSRGWCIAELISFDPEMGRIRIRAVELFECLPLKGKLTEPRSHLFRGYLAGIAGKVLERSVKVEEVLCVAKGDPHCEFIIAITS